MRDFPEIGTKIHLGQQRKVFRVMGFRTLRGKQAVALCAPEDYAQWNESRRAGALVECPAPARIIPIADLVKDEGRRGWREREQQGGLDL